MFISLLLSYYYPDKYVKYKGRNLQIKGEKRTGEGEKEDSSSLPYSCIAWREHRESFSLILFYTFDQYNVASRRRRTFNV